VNGSWDPLAAVMADDGETTSTAEEDPWRAAAAEPDFDRLEFTRLSKSATLPTRAHDGDAGLDLYAAEAATIAPGQRVSVGTGLAVAIPPGLAGLVVPRSGLALKHGIALVNSPGVIDSGYRGELRVLLLNTDAAEEFKLAPGDRVAQLLLTPIAAVNPLEADSLDSTTRGDGGFGSTGA
jgi:dUTP pyrophosphatase